MTQNYVGEMHQQVFVEEYDAIRMFSSETKHARCHLTDYGNTF